MSKDTGTTTTHYTEIEAYRRKIDEQQAEIERLRNGINDEIMFLDGSASGIDPVVILAATTATNLRRLLKPGGDDARRTTD